MQFHVKHCEMKGKHEMQMYFNYYLFLKTNILTFFLFVIWFKHYLIRHYMKIKLDFYLQQKYNLFLKFMLSFKNHVIY